MNANSKPILFTGPNVVRLMPPEDQDVGPKTQTRRILGKRNTLIDGYLWSLHATKFEDLDFSRATGDNGPSPAGNPGPYLHVPRRDGETWHRIYPKYAPGDLLWVRETWYCDHCEVPERGKIPKEPPRGAVDLLYYRARDLAPGGETYTGFSGETMHNPWRPSIFMPRWASCLTLRISSVRVERLQEISTNDINAEGIDLAIDYDQTGNRFVDSEDMRDQFRDLWDSINAKRGYSWDSNPYVWVIEWDKVWNQNVDTVGDG